MQEELENFSVELQAPDCDDFSKNLQKMCTNLLNKNEFVDCTLACSDGQLQVHRIVLATTSQYLYNLFSGMSSPSPCAHPVIMLRKWTIADVRIALQFIYGGKAQVTKSHIPALMHIARELGCNSLVKAIENAIQSFGAGMFRRLSGTVDNISSFTNISSDGQTTSSTDLSGEVDRPKPVVKTEPADPTDTISSSDGPPCLSPNLGSPGVTLTPVSFPDLSKRPDNNFSNASIEMGNLNSQVNIQHEKGESFVYTNEDLGMTLDQDESDNNESGDEDSELPSTTVTVRNISPLETTKVENEEQNYIGEVPANCPWCMQVFTNLTLLQRHIKSHVGNYKPFICTYCNNTFARSAHLKRHLRTHTGEKPYQCSICQRLFARQDKLKIHLERHLQNSNKSTSMTITSYPQPSVSQSTGGQVPIKVLIPTGGTQGGGNFSRKMNNVDDILVRPNSMENGSILNSSTSSGSKFSNKIQTSCPATITSIQSPPNSSDIKFKPVNYPFNLLLK